MRRLLGVSMVAAVALTACVTINVYLRAAEAEEAAKREVREKVAEAQARQRQRLRSIAAVSPGANVPSTLKPAGLKAATLRMRSTPGLDAATLARARQLASALPRPASLEPDNRMPDDRE